VLTQNEKALNLKAFSYSTIFFKEPYRRNKGFPIFKNLN